MKRGMKIAWAHVRANLYCIRYFWKGYHIETLRWHDNQKVCNVRVARGRKETWKFIKDFYSELY
jgi:hypothetical protein